MGAPGAENSFPYPGDDPGTVRQAAAGLRNGHRRLGALIGGLESSLSSMMQSWQGADAEAARGEVTALASAARLLAERTDDAVAAMDRHGDDLDRIRRSVDGLRNEWMPSLSPRSPDDPRTGWIADPYADPLVRSVTEPDLFPRLRARWQALVHEQEDSARACVAALADAGGGRWQYAPGSGTVRGDLGSAIGLTALTFDDRLDAAHAAHAWSALTPDEQALYAARAEDSMSALLDGDPAAAGRTWRGLDAFTQQALIHLRPQDIGTIDGVSVEARDQANRILLPQQREVLQAEVDALETEGVSEGYLDGQFRVELFGSAESNFRNRYAAARARLNALDDIAGSVSAGEDATGVPRHTYLMALDVTGSGQVAIAYGNPDTADQVVSLVPGTGSNLGGVVGDAERVKLMMKAAEESGDGSVAGVTWTNYLAPQSLPNAALGIWADTAVGDLRSYADGLRASHEGDDPFRSVIAAHSYGTVLTTGAAAADNPLDADALILLGSPGTNLDSVHDVHLTGVDPDEIARHVFASTTDADLVGDLPLVSGYAPFAPDLGFSGDPTRPGWGATVFETEANHSIGYYRFSDHGRYWDPESPQLRTIGDVIADRYQGGR